MMEATQERQAAVYTASAPRRHQEQERGSRVLRARPLPRFLSWALGTAAGQCSSSPAAGMAAGRTAKTSGRK